MLLSEEHIEIKKELRPPALLSTCSKLRNEAVGIWYLEQRFTLTMTDCDSDLSTKFLALAKFYGTGQSGRYTFNAEIGRPNWTNLMTWCQRTHAEKMGALEYFVYQCHLRKVVTAATVMARSQSGTRVVKVP